MHYRGREEASDGCSSCRDSFDGPAHSSNRGPPTGSTLSSRGGRRRQERARPASSSTKRRRRRDRGTLHNTSSLGVLSSDSVAESASRIAVSAAFRPRESGDPHSRSQMPPTAMAVRDEDARCALSACVRFLRPASPDCSMTAPRRHLKENYRYSIAGVCRSGWRRL